MHELHLLNEILEKVKEAVKDKPVKEVKRIKLKVGITKMVTPEGLQETLKVMEKDKIFDDTKLEVEIIPEDGFSIEEVEIVEA
jgi:Zn finger protein HypA/HybF involved in hydrogenase expression